MLLKLSSELLRTVLSYCVADSLCKLCQSCRTFGIELRDNMMEDLWRQLCFRGWRNKVRTSKILGAETMKDTYRSLLQRLKIPRGKYTEKFNHVFGKGRANGVCSWVLIGHSDNARLRPRRGRNVVTLRVCILNTRNAAVTLDLSPDAAVPLIGIRSIEDGWSVGAQADGRELEVEMSDGGCESEIGSAGNSSFTARRTGSLLKASNFTLLAKNGITVCAFPGQLFTELNPLDSCVIECEICCSTNVRYESDFLAMIRGVQVTLCAESNLGSFAKHPCNNTMVEVYGGDAPNQMDALCSGWSSCESSEMSVWQSSCENFDFRSLVPSHRWVTSPKPLLSSKSLLEVMIPTVVEHEIWDFYMELPGGVVLLRDKPLSTLC